MKLNRIILDSNGRILLIASHPKVLELLENAGVQNFIKVCNSYADVERISELIATPGYQAVAPEAQGAPVQQPAAAQTPPPAPAPQTPPQSREEEVLRSVTSFPTQKIPVVDANTPAPAFDDEPEEKEAIREFSDTYKKETNFEYNDLEEPKRIPVGVVIVSLLVVALLVGGGAYYYLTQMANKPGGEAQNEVTVKPTKDEKSDLEKINQILADTAKADTAKAEEKTPEVKTPVKSTGKIEIKRAKRPTTTTTTRTERKTEPSGRAKVITITSYPSGAKVYASGSYLGKTPVEWKNPPIYGDVTFTFKKDGYSETQKAAQYFEKSMSVHAKLQSGGGSSSSSSASNDAAAKRAEENRRAEEARRAEDARRAEENRRAEQARQDEANRRAEQARQDEANRRAEQARQDEANRRAQEAANAKAAEDARRAEEARKLEEQRRAQRAAEIKARQEEEARKAEQARKAEEKRKAEEAAKKKAAEKGTIFISSLPPMAKIYNGATFIGKANTGAVSLPTGTHTLTLKHGDKTATQTVTLRSGKNSPIMVRLK